MADAARFSGSVRVNNHGGPAGGAVRGVVNVNWNNPLFDGGQLSISADGRAVAAVRAGRL